MAQESDIELQGIGQDKPAGVVHAVPDNRESQAGSLTKIARFCLCVSLTLSAISLAFAIWALIEIGKVQSVAVAGGVSAGLSSPSDFLGLWSGPVQSVEQMGPYNSTPAEVEIIERSARITYSITSVDPVTRIFLGARCSGNISAVSASLAGVISADLTEAVASIYFRNGAEDTPAYRWGTWRWNFLSPTKAEILLQNNLNIQTQDPDSFVGIANVQRESKSNSCR